MSPLALMGIMGGAGLLKSELVDRPKEERQRKLAALTQLYSPWTGLQAGGIEEADPLREAMQYGFTGANLGRQMNRDDAEAAMYERLSRGSSLPRGASVSFGGNSWSPPAYKTAYEANLANDYGFYYP